MEHNNSKNEAKKFLLQELITIYRPYQYGYDWLHWPIKTHNRITIHHIVKKCDGGTLSIENAAILTIKAHQILNICEINDEALYNDINEFFKEIVFWRAPLNEHLINESIKYGNHLRKVLNK